MNTTAAPRTLYDKLWDAHVVGTSPDGDTQLYIDRLILHEVTSAQAFAGLEMTHRTLWRSGSIFAVADHQVPTTDRARGMDGFTDATARLQVQTLDDNCDRYGIDQFKLNDLRQGIVHVVEGSAAQPASHLGEGVRVAAVQLGLEIVDQPRRVVEVELAPRDLEEHHRDAARVRRVELDDAPRPRQHAGRAEENDAV